MYGYYFMVGIVCLVLLAFYLRGIQEKRKHGSDLHVEHPPRLDLHRLGRSDGVGFPERRVDSISPPVINLQYKAMNLVDEIKGIIVRQPLNLANMSFFSQVNLEKITSEEGSPERTALINTLMDIADDAFKRGFPRARSVAISLHVFEEMVRHSIAHAVEKRLVEVGTDYVQSEDLRKEQLHVTEELTKMKGNLEVLRKEIEATTANKSVEQFRAFLLYAADMWGDEKERKVIDGLVKKVAVPEITKNGREIKADRSLR